jgi:hypothetical protein
MCLNNKLSIGSIDRNYFPLLIRNTDVGCVKDSRFEPLLKLGEKKYFEAN